LIDPIGKRFANYFENRALATRILSFSI